MDFEYLAPDGCYYQSKEDYVWIGVLGMCGCGSDEPRKYVFDMLKKYQERGSDWQSGPKIEDTFSEFVAHFLDSKKLTEHGGSVYGAWLTKKGQEVCKLIFDNPEPRCK